MTSSAPARMPDPLLSGMLDYLSRSYISVIILSYTLDPIYSLFSPGSWGQSQIRGQQKTLALYGQTDKTRKAILFTACLYAVPLWF